MTENEHREEWLKSPAKFCDSCGSRETYEQMNLCLDCRCGCGNFIEMTEEQGKDAREAFDKDYRDFINKRREIRTEMSTALILRERWAVDDPYQDHLILRHDVAVYEQFNIKELELNDMKKVRIWAVEFIDNQTRWFIEAEDGHTAAKNAVVAANKVGHFYKSADALRISYCMEVWVRCEETSGTL